MVAFRSAAAGAALALAASITPAVAVDARRLIELPTADTFCSQWARTCEAYVTKHTKHKRGYGFDNDCEPGTSLGGTTAEAAVTCFVIPAKGAPVDVTAKAVDAAGLVAA